MNAYNKFVLACSSQICCFLNLSSPTMGDKKRAIVVQLQPATKYHTGTSSLHPPNPVEQGKRTGEKVKPVGWD